MTRLFFLLVLFPGFLFAQDKYYYAIDLANVVNDKVKVTLNCPKINEPSATFVVPNVIPGSYSWKEYGRFFTDIKATDINGAPVKIIYKKGVFTIKKGADKLSKIEYWVNDTWDDTDYKNFVFQPGGSNIEERKNFMLNFHAFAGYFEGYKNLPFEIEITKPAGFYGSTWLKKKSSDETKDVLVAQNYFLLADNPAMYCSPDTASFTVENTKIVVSNYSTHNLVKADSLSKWLTPLVFSLKSFFGALPVEEYHFIFYFASRDQVPEIDPGKGLSGFGALEHHHTSVYFLPEDMGDAKTKDMVQDVGAHEFLHIITPLNLHSKEISDFDFNNPKMSQHLWLYEGVTEYFSWLTRVQSGLVTEEQFFNEMTDKLTYAEKYLPFSFTDMSKNVLAKENQAKYLNVYQKGAVMAMMLDQLLIKKSEGKYSLKHLVNDLMKQYGSERPFEDTLLFAEMEKLSFPEVKNFINNYIIGSEALPITTYMSWFGYQYAQEEKLKAYYIASFAAKMNDKDQFVVEKIYGARIDLQPKDVIVAVNGQMFNKASGADILLKYFRYNTSPEKVTLTLLRNGKEISVTGTPVEGTATKKHQFKKLNAEGVETIYNAWLKGTYVVN